MASASQDSSATSRPPTRNTSRPPLRRIAITLLALALLALVADNVSGHRGIPLWAPPADTTRWVLGDGLLRVEHTFATPPAPRWWPRFNAWVIDSGTWTDLDPMLGPQPIGYADLVLAKLAGLFFAAAVAASLLAFHQPSRPAATQPRCHHCRYDLRATPERCPECGKPAMD